MDYNQVGENNNIKVYYDGTYLSIQVTVPEEEESFQPGNILASMEDVVIGGFRITLKVEVMP